MKHAPLCNSRLGEEMPCSCELNKAIHHRNCAYVLTNAVCSCPIRDIGKPRGGKFYKAQHIDFKVGDCDVRVTLDIEHLGIDSAIPVKIMVESRPEIHFVYDPSSH